MTVVRDAWLYNYVIVSLKFGLAFKNKISVGTLNTGGFRGCRSGRLPLRSQKKTDLLKSGIFFTF